MWLQASDAIVDGFSVWFRSHSNLHPDEFKILIVALMLETCV